MTMDILRDWDLQLDVDTVLRGQGADPAVVRNRSPRLVEIAAQAMQDGLGLLHPQVLHRRIPVKDLRHQRLTLAEGATLSGELIAQHLGPATEVIVVLCTVGQDLEARASEIMVDDMLAALALDGLGSAAVEMLANAACARFETEAKAAGLQATIPLSPGMEGWPVEVGQPEIFHLLDGQPIGITLTPSLMMLPRKSLSMVLGLGKDVTQAGSTCDYCTMRETCRYQDHYAKDAA